MRGVLRVGLGKKRRCWRSAFVLPATPLSALARLGQVARGEDMLVLLVW